MPGPARAYGYCTVSPSLGPGLCARAMARSTCTGVSSFSRWLWEAHVLIEICAILFLYRLDYEYLLVSWYLKSSSKFDLVCPSSQPHLSQAIFFLGGRQCISRCFSDYQVSNFESEVLRSRILLEAEAAAAAFQADLNLIGQKNFELILI